MPVKPCGGTAGVRGLPWANAGLASALGGPSGARWSRGRPATSSRTLSRPWEHVRARRGAVGWCGEGEVTVRAERFDG